MKRAFPLLNALCLFWPNFKPYRRVPAIALLASLAFAQQSGAGSGTNPPSAPITIPDGAQIELRFAQTLGGKATRGYTGLPPIVGMPGEARRGDLVPIVVQTNVRVAGRIVIAKGAVGQATVTSTYDPAAYIPDADGRLRRYNQPGLSLRLDWVKSVNDREIPLRAHKQGKSGAFLAKVEQTNGGTVLQAGSATKSVLKALAWSSVVLDVPTPTPPAKTNWIPTGTRMMAFVQGPIKLDASEVEQAQTQLPISNTAALLTIYRTQDNDRNLQIVACDGEPLAQLGTRQYKTLEIAPGAHSCRVAGKKPLAITMLRGDEYFLRVRRTFGGGWELKLVTSGEGEDEIANAELLAPQ